MSDIDPKLQSHADDIATSDVAKEKAAKAAEDAALDVKVAIGHEPSDIKVQPLLALGVVALVIGAVTTAALYGMFVYFQSRPSGAQPPSALGLPRPSPPAPRLQTDPVADWQALQATEEAALHSYGWADQSAGKVRIPIERAMELLVQRGVPVAPGSTRQFNDQRPSLDSSGGQVPGPTSAAAPQNTGPAEAQPAAATPTPGH